MQEVLQQRKHTRRVKRNVGRKIREMQAKNQRKCTERVGKAARGQKKGTEEELKKGRKRNKIKGG
jgi:hypothetical protein